MRANEFITEGYEGLLDGKNVPGENIFPGKNIVGQRVYHVTNRLKSIIKSGGLKPKYDETGAREYGRDSTKEHPFRPVIAIWFAVGKPDWFGKYVLSWEIEPTDKTAVAYAKSKGELNPNVVLNPISMDRITVTDHHGNPIDIDAFMNKGKNVNEVNDPGHLEIPDDLLRQFIDRGWEIYGEGRDQVALGKPGSRYVLKIVGRGSDTRIDIVRKYIDFYRKNQGNPFFPKVGGDRKFYWENEPYYAYTQEKLHDLPGDEAVLDYIEGLMEKLVRDEEPDFSNIPKGLNAQQVEGLIKAVNALFNSGMGDINTFDLTNTYNIMQRDNGQMVLVDPFAGWD
jgi:hypothetical protein